MVIGKKCISKISSDLEACSLYLKSNVSDNRSLSYRNAKDSLYVLFELTNRCPPLLFPDLIERIETENLKHELPVLQMMRCGVRQGKYWINFNPELFITNEKITPAYFCLNQQELQDAAAKLLDLTIHSILPILNRIDMDGVYPTEELYTKLSADPSGRAASFSKKYGFPICTTAEAVKRLESLLNSLLLSAGTARADFFSANEDMMLGAVAYLGECAVQEYGGKWEWVSSNPCFKEKDSYRVVSNKLVTTNFCPLNVIALHWTLHGLVSAFGLDNFRLQ